MGEIAIDKAVADACKALGLQVHELLASGIYSDGRVVIVTVDGRKIEWRKADKAEKAAAQKGREK